MSSFKKRMSANNIKWLVSLFLIAILSVAVVFAFVKIDKNEKTRTLGSNIFTYSVGLIDTEGKFEQGTSSIYTKDFTSVDGLTVEIKDDATITYKLFFFDKDEKLVEMTSALSSDYDSSLTPETAEYFKIMITPTNDAEVSWFEIGTYAKQLTVTVNK